MNNLDRVKVNSAIKKATITDVAKRANVSISTVSHVMNHTATISPKTKQRVYNSVNELHYKTNALARGLRQNKTKVIGLVVPDIRNEFYASCASGVLQEADKYHYTAFLCDCCYNIEREERSINTLIEQCVDGLIFFGGSDDEFLIRAVEQANIPVILGDRKLDGYNSVGFANAKVVRNLINTLYQRGKRKFCYVTEPVEMENLKERYSGFQLGLKDCGLEQNGSMVLVDKRLQKEKVSNAQKVISEYLDEPGNEVPDVILTSCDIIAFGVMAALRAKGYRIPEDIGVVGFDNIQLSAYTFPPLTTVAQDMFLLGQQTFSMLLQMIRGEPQSLIQLTLEPELIIRDSV